MTNKTFRYCFRNLFAILSLSVFFNSCGSKLAEVPEGSETISVDDNDIVMVYIQPGSFTMGGTQEQTDCDYFKEKPEHKVTITKPYFISQTEVTQELWQDIMGSNPSLYKSHDDSEKYLPVVNVSWDECKIFIKKLNAKTGRNFRLPTEAEWEYAARGAGKGYMLQYAGSKYADRVACLKTNSGGHPFPVAKFGANEIGLYDMSGNVWEWVEDNFEQYTKDEATDPCVVTGDSLPHSVRGGSFTDTHSKCRTSTRDGFTADYKQTNLGFRLAMSK